MNTIAKLAQSIGNAAAYAFWGTAVLVMVGFVAVVLTYDLTVSFTVGQIFAVVAGTMFLSIGVMMVCSRIIKLQEKRQA